MSPETETSNRNGSENQITSEQILKEAYENRKLGFEKPKHTIQDLEELESYQRNKRGEYEQHLNKNRLDYGQWTRYAKWEVEQNHDFSRARSILERALEVNYQHVPFWTFYVQLELSHGNVNHARNLLERAVTLLPRVDKFWFMYAQTEETLKNYDGVRRIFERWIEWHPGSQCWRAYTGFEKRYREYENARSLYKRYVKEFNSGEAWLKWINFELNEVPKDLITQGYMRRVFELSIDSILSSSTVFDDPSIAEIVDKWTTWEASVDELERAHAIYSFFLESEKVKDRISTNLKVMIFDLSAEFERKYGDKNMIEQSTKSKRILVYENYVQKSPEDYESWLLLINLIKYDQDKEKVRQTFERAIQCMPADKYKSSKWRRYVYLCIKYSLWEEIEEGEISRARNIWKRALDIIPHRKFTSAKLWIGYAEFELRNSEDEAEALQKARRILGRSIGQSSSNGPKNKIFKYYISLESKLGEWDRVRKLFEKKIELYLLVGDPMGTHRTLKEYIDFEKSLEEHARCVALFELGISLEEEEEVMRRDQDRRIWASYIDYLKDEMRYEEARRIYTRLLSSHPEVDNWIAFALFESSIPSEEQMKNFEETEQEEFQFEITETNRNKTREIFEKSDAYFKSNGPKEDRVVILEAWRNYELSHGTSESADQIAKRLPTIVKRMKFVDGVNEEHLDYIFPEDGNENQKIPGLGKFMANAKLWMATQT